ncbi:DotU family type IV/VI secretion system protein [Massilia sp. CCM 9210]|uniref:DotU family type IV/VI secretion system protein n=1 Tax=Massilia scottii TaxID=3057166 RepID=UPI002796CCF0|nr:DotU family type IV/VI secretion system protein [Massilia sp. CCM 9210]MDQ1812076.1 DotU family type IV/VI secretion system protein [Massilia sp. CCM 9210]
MPTEPTAALFLLGHFSEFYEEVASIKQSFLDGTLLSSLALGDEAPPSHPSDVAARVAGGLLAILARQSRQVQSHASAMEAQAYACAQYAMAALADEIFVLELAWNARDAWLDTLLESRLFGSRCAGQQLFDQIDHVLANRERSTLQSDLAAVYLLTLQLGFRGIHRGPSGAQLVQSYREQLFRLVNGARAGAENDLACPQAYQHVLVGKTDARLAPLAPWIAMARLGTIGYAVLSSAGWIALVWPYAKYFFN